MKVVGVIEKNLRSKQAESQVELDVLRIKYGKMKSQYQSLEMEGLKMLSLKRLKQ